MTENIVEKFCPVCVLPIAAAIGGATATGVGLTTEEEKKKKKRILIITGLISIFVPLIIWFCWVKFFSKCKSCKL